MKRLWIAGAGSFGREVCDWAADIRRENPRWDLAGLLDDNPVALAGKPCSLPLVGPITSHVFTADDCLVIAIANSKVREQLTLSLTGRVAFETLVHPTCRVGSFSHIGAGSILCPYAVVTTNASLGCATIANLHSTITHDVQLGDFCTLSDHVDLCGHVRVGHRVFFGTHAAVTPGVIIGDDAVIGAGATVINDVAANATMISTAARPLPRRID